MLTPISSEFLEPVPTGVPADRGLHAPGCSSWKVLVSGGPTCPPGAPAQEQSPSTGPFVRLFMFLKHADSHGVRIKVPWALHVCVLTWQAVVKERTLSFTLWTWLPEGTGSAGSVTAPGPSWRERGQGTPRGHRSFPGPELPWMWACGNPSLIDVGRHWAEGSFWGSPPSHSQAAPCRARSLGSARFPAPEFRCESPSVFPLGLPSIHCPTDVTLCSCRVAASTTKAEPGGWVLYSAAAVPGPSAWTEVCVLGGCAQSGTE